jgi:hypothetical protein
MENGFRGGHGMTLVGNVMLNPDFIGTGSFQDLMSK